MTIIILAGGKSCRMGYRDKALLRIGRYSIIARQLKAIRKHFKKIIIVANDKPRYEAFKGVKVVRDIIPSRGPLGGILSGLAASGDRRNFVIACDMPFVDPRLMLRMCKYSAGYDVVIPEIDGKRQPLFAVYSKNCIRHIRPLVVKKPSKISGFFSKVNVRKIGRSDVSLFGDPDRIFMNINTPDDLAKING